MNDIIRRTSANVRCPLHRSEEDGVHDNTECIADSQTRPSNTGYNDSQSSLILTGLVSVRVIAD